MAIHQVVTSVGLSLAKRASSSHEDDTFVVSGLGVLLNVATFLVFAPIIFWTSYTLMSVYPTLAIVEDPNPPAYERVSLSDNVDDPEAPGSPSGSHMITSSFRSIHRLLQENGGFRSHFRGFVCAIVISLGKGFVSGLFEAIPFVPAFVGTIVAMLALVQFYTAWVHIVITPLDNRPFYKRLPPFGKAFEATVIPIAIYGAAQLITATSVFLLAAILGLPLWTPSHPNEVPKFEAAHAWKTLIVAIVAIVLTLGLIYPAHVVLVRVQASLLPPDEDAILPFDRSFGGTIEPAVVSGKGYATWTNALKTFPRSSWIRLYKLMAKSFGAAIAVYLTLLALMGATIALLSATH